MVWIWYNRYGSGWVAVPNTTCQCEPLPISHTGVIKNVTKLEDLHTRIPNKHLIDGMMARLDGNSFKVYVAILLYADWKTGKSYITQKRIGELTGIKDRKTVRIHIKALVMGGYITTQKQKRKRDGLEYGHRRYEYTIVKPESTKVMGNSCSP